MIHSGKQLDYAYRYESHANVRERILLLRRVRIDNQEAASVAELELHRFRGWAYKWLKRYNNEGILGLKDKPRSGRPADVPVEKLLEVRKELSENPSGWKVKQIMNIIYERTGVRYHEVLVYRLLHKWGFKPKVPQRRFINTASKEEKEVFKKSIALFFCSNIPTVDSIVTRVKSYGGVQGVELFITTKVVVYRQEWLVREVNKKLRSYTKTTTIRLPAVK